LSNEDKRLIEDYLPIEAVSAESAREKSIRKGHISTLHMWWARRPLVACRAAVYAALVPTSRFRPTTGPEEKRASLTRANAAKFIKGLCTYPGSSLSIREAETHILEAHAERLTREGGKKVTVEDILAGRAPRPRVIDIFSGGGAIPLEALRLGCETYALDLNPVAHIIELATLVYPEKYGKPEQQNTGSGRDGRWAGLSEEVQHWGAWCLKQAKSEIGHLYPLVPDPHFKGRRHELNVKLWKEDVSEIPNGYLIPTAYLWTRVVCCKNPNCRADVPLARQTWLCKREKRYIALRATTPRNEKKVRFEICEARTAKALGFDPEAGSRGGNATCPFCGSIADIDYVKSEASRDHLREQLMAVVCSRPGESGKEYLSATAEKSQILQLAGTFKCLERCPEPVE
jgi:putative DNA methylase